MPPSIDDLLELAIQDYEGPLFGYAYNLLKNRETAREVVQDTLLRLCQQEPDKVSTHLKSWLFTVCRNRCFDILRKENKKKFSDPEVLEYLPDTGNSPLENTLRKESYQEVLEVLSRLSSNQQEAILLKFQNGLSYKEIEKVTGLSQSNVGFLIHTGLKKVRQLLGEDPGQI